MAKRKRSTSAEYNWIPWTLTAAALTAFAALYFTADRFIGLPMLAFLLAPSHVIKWRLPASRLSSWGLRILIVVAMIAWIGWPHEDIRSWYLQPQFTKLFGCLLATEYVIRAWERHDASRPGEAWGVALLLTALVLTAASNTFVRTYLRVLAPAYLFFVTLFLRNFVPRRRVTFGVREAESERTSARMRWRLAAMRGAAILIALALGLTVAELVNRFDYQLTSLAVRLLQQTNRSPGEIGFDSAPQLGSIFNPNASTERVLRIEGPRAERHLRVMAFDDYSRQLWLPTLRDRQFKEIPVKQFLEGSPASTSRRLRITRLADTVDLLPVPLEVTSIAIQGSVERDRFGCLRSFPAGSNASYDLESPASETPPRPDVSSLTPHVETPANFATDAYPFERMLTVPVDLDPGVMTLARQVAGEGNAATRVARIAQHLRSTHGYSLQFRPHGEPLSDFILNRRSAHCQYFGSAMVVMARAAGIPARYVTGFYAHEGYGLKDMVVRQRDAHAWAECWIDGAGWVTVDATPAGGRPDEEYPDPPRARVLWEKLGDLLLDAKQWLVDMDSRKVLQVVGVLSVAGLLVAGVRSLLSRRRRGKVTSAYTSAPADLALVTQRFERWLSTRTEAPAPDRTWREQIKTIPLPVENAEACATFITAYEDVRFGGVTAEKVRMAGALLANVEKHR